MPGTYRRINEYISQLLGSDALKKAFYLYMNIYPKFSVEGFLSSGEDRSEKLYYFRRTPCQTFEATKYLSAVLHPFSRQATQD